MTARNVIARRSQRRRGDLVAHEHERAVLTQFCASPLHSNETPKENSGLSKWHLQQKQHRKKRRASVLSASATWVRRWRGTSPKPAGKSACTTRMKQKHAASFPHMAAAQRVR